MDRLPAITGIGLVSPLAVGAAETWRALLEGRCIRDHARTPLDSTSPDRIHRLALAAAEEAVAEAGWLQRKADSGRTALVVGTSKGEVEAWMTAPPSPITPTSDKPKGRSDESGSFGLSATAAAVRQAMPLLDGPGLTLSAACASGLHALIRASMMIRSGEADRVLVLAAEASVHPLFLSSFKRLGVLPAEGVGCRPFDASRDGFLMSEAAAAVCLEAAGETNQPRPYAAVENFAFGGDASHLTGGDADGSTLRYLIKKVVAARPVDLIHAHGTGTVFNDPIELAAFDDLCGIGTGDRDDVVHPLVYSHKGALGHSLGSAGMMSVVLSCQMHRHGIVPPNVQTHTPLATKRVRIVREAVRTPIRRSIAVAAGFGGATAVISLVSG